MIGPQFWGLLALVIPSIVVDLVLAIPSPRRQTAVRTGGSTPWVGGIDLVHVGTTLLVKVGGAGSTRPFAR